MKGLTEDIISETLHENTLKSDSQRYPVSLYLINNDGVIHIRMSLVLTRVSRHSIFSCKIRMIPSSMIRERFKGYTVVNLNCSLIKIKIIVTIFS